jgi:hypothetical protein
MPRGIKGSGEAVKKEPKKETKLADGEIFGICQCDIAYKGDRFWAKLSDDAEIEDIYVTATEEIKGGDRVIIDKNNKARKA